MKTIEQIKAEIERRLSYYHPENVNHGLASGFREDGKAIAYKELLSFLDTLKEQPVKKMLMAEDCPYRSSRVLHDERGEFHLCHEHGGDCECIPNGCPYLVARNSEIKLPDIPGYVVRENAYEKERNEMLSKIDEEKIKALKEQPVDFPTTDEEMKQFLATHPRVEVPEKYKTPDWLFEKTNLDEAEFRYVESSNIPPANQEEEKMVYDAFKAGAMWDREQGVSFNTEVGWIDGPTIMDWPDDILDGFKMGDKVIVQIRKKDE